MKVTKIQTFEQAGQVMEGPHQGELVIRPTTEINITLTLQEFSKIVMDLSDLDPSRINGTTKVFLAKLQAVKS